MKRKLGISLFLLANVFLMLGFCASVLAMDVNLANLLTKELGVSQSQAEGGAGAIFNTASQKMSAEDFAKVTDALPEVRSLMEAAPSLGKASDALGGTSMLGENKSGGSSLAALSASFLKLGLSGDMVGKFIPIVLQYAQTKGGDFISGLLKTALQ